ncbi:GntR family transcriptional regulator [Pelagicoccus mobilis]|uniref:GntR family transcriptional regulator n=1 Tax=Pelagicoccus mobilis TaxID=415221 RepID=A0A934S349_9BACT|nr:GntR family transcriptional regulator [Pelagicoccus mobilis]MBK1878952.1 GntR family transcriptional regulator [Pelagicoccus mobilis]
MKRIEQQDLGQLVYDMLKALIYKKELKPGEQIRQEEVSKRLGVSRTPLLKALQMLEHESLVEFIPRRGVFVKKYDLQELIEIFELREVLEGLAAKRAAARMDSRQTNQLRALFTPFIDQTEIDCTAYEKADQSFHRKVLEIGSGSVLKRYRVVQNIPIIAYQMGLHVPPEVTLADHLELIEAMSDQDADKAEQLMRKHLSRGRIELSKRLEQEEAEALEEPVSAT